MKHFRSVVAAFVLATVVTSGASRAQTGTHQAQTHLLAREANLDAVAFNAAPIGTGPDSSPCSFSRRYAPPVSTSRSKGTRRSIGFAPNPVTPTWNAHEWSF